jgi:hypothetical protein
VSLVSKLAGKIAVSSVFSQVKRTRRSLARLLHAFADNIFTMSLFTAIKNGIRRRMPSRRRHVRYALPALLYAQYPDSAPRGAIF